MEEDRKLVDDFRQAWTEFDRSLRALQAISAAPVGKDAEPLLFAVEAARAKYSEARDRLAAKMLNGSLPTRQGLANRDLDQARIRGSARLLWEFSGKPNGSAEKDWLQAETLVRSAANGK